jgi:hypothetical protein
MSDPNNLEGDPPTPEERAAMARELDRVAPTPADKFALMFGQRPTPRTDKAEYQVRLGRHRRMVVRPELARQLERELDEAREQRDRLAVIAGELIAVVRVNSMRDTFREATVEQIDEWLKPWVSRLAAIEGKEQV